MPQQRTNRRAFITLLGGAAVAPSLLWPLAARAQQRAVPVIGILDDAAGTGPPGERPDVFLQTLKDNGFVEGQTVAFERRNAEGRLDRLPALAAELVQRRVAIILTSSPPGARAAKAATSTIPILFGMGEDPVREGIVDSFNRPGGNITGFTNFGNLLVPKRVELLRELVPGAAAYGLLVNPNNPNVEPDTNDALAAAATLGLELRVFKASNDGELSSAFDAAVAERLGALLVGVDNLLFRPRRGLIVALAARHALPAIYERRDFALAGGLLSYGTDGADNARQSALYVARILKGAKPGDLPILQSSKFELVVNLNAAKALKMDMPTAILLRATELIE